MIRSVVIWMAPDTDRWLLRDERRQPLRRERVAERQPAHPRQQLVRQQVESQDTGPVRQQVALGSSVPRPLKTALGTLDPLRYGPCPVHEIRNLDSRAPGGVALILI